MHIIMQLQCRTDAYFIQTNSATKTTVTINRTTADTVTLTVTAEPPSSLASVVPVRGFSYRVSIDCM